MCGWIKAKQIATVNREKNRLQNGFPIALIKLIMDIWSERVRLMCTRYVNDMPLIRVYGQRCHICTTPSEIISKWQTWINFFSFQYVLYDVKITLATRFGGLNVFVLIWYIEHLKKKTCLSICYLITSGAPFTNIMGLIVAAWISNQMPSKVWDEMT